MFDHLPFADPGTPDLSTPGRFLRWIGMHQKRLLGLGILWGVLWMVCQALIPGALGAGVIAAAPCIRALGPERRPARVDQVRVRLAHLLHLDPQTLASTRP